MGYNKKAGILMMVASVASVPISFLISSCTYCDIFIDKSLFTRIMIGYRIQLFQYVQQDFSDGYLIDVSIKYVLLLCIVTCALGLLYYLEVLNAPRKRTPDEVATTPDK